MASGFVTLILAGAAAATQPANPLDNYRDRGRVLIISAPTALTRDLRRQTHELAGFSAQMNDRDLLTVRVVGAQATDMHGATLDATAVRHQAGLSPDRFGVVLVGKDGGVKLRRSSPISAAALFDVIDAMPMRRNEMSGRGDR